MYKFLKKRKDFYYIYILLLLLIRNNIILIISLIINQQIIVLLLCICIYHLGLVKWMIWTRQWSKKPSLKIPWCTSWSWNLDKQVQIEIFPFVLILILACVLFCLWCFHYSASAYWKPLICVTQGLSSQMKRNMNAVGPGQAQMDLSLCVAEHRSLHYCEELPWTVPGRFTLSICSH